MNTAWLKARYKDVSVVDLSSFGRITLSHACYFVCTNALDPAELLVLDATGGGKVVCWKPGQDGTSAWRPLNPKATELAGKTVYGDAFLYEGYELES